MPMLLALVGDPTDLSDGTGGGGGPALDITTTSLPDAIAGEAYSATVVATGGTAPYTFSVLSGALPVWASLAGSTGVISGTASGSGTASFTIRVTDGASATDDQALSITTSALTSIPGRRRAGWLMTFGMG